MLDLFSPPDDVFLFTQENQKNEIPFLVCIRGALVHKSFVRRIYRQISGYTRCIRNLMKQQKAEKET